MNNSGEKSSNLVVLISGNGSNLQAILDACAAQILPARITAVVSDQPNAYGLERAQRANVSTHVLQKTKPQSRAEYDTALANLITPLQPDWIILAGWMRLLSPTFLNHFPNRVINLHPALPGAFPGTHAIERAFAAFQSGTIRETGVMVHLVPDEGIDNGPLLAQQTVPIHPHDTLETLSSRIHATEHRLLIETLSKLLNTSEFAPCP